MVNLMFINWFPLESIFTHTRKGLWRRRSPAIATWSSACRSHALLVRLEVAHCVGHTFYWRGPSTDHTYYSKRNTVISQAWLTVAHFSNHMCYWRSPSTDRTQSWESIPLSSNLFCAVRYPIFLPPVANTEVSSWGYQYDAWDSPV